LIVPKSGAPVFILGSPRSGTTLLYHMILSAGDFAIYRTESNVFNLLLPKFGDLRVRANRQRLLDFWLRSKLFTRSGLHEEEIKARILNSCQSGGDFLRIVMGEIARSQNVRRWAECTPEHLLYMLQIQEAIPEALIIHIIRDGRDVALSLAQQNWIRPYPWQKDQGVFVAGLFWEWMVRKGRALGATIGHNYLEVRFEDLVKSPSETLSVLGRFIDHDLDYERIRRVAIGSVEKPNTSFGSECKAEPFEPIGRWRQGFSPDGLLRFEGLVGPFLEKLGYPLATPPDKLDRSLALRQMRALYRFHFQSKLWLRNKTPLGRILIRPDLSRF
jgi:hypothetical protein